MPATAEGDDRRRTLPRIDRGRRVGKALAYRAALTDEPVSAHAEMEFPVRGWLLELLEG